MKVCIFLIATILMTLQTFDIGLFDIFIFIIFFIISYNISVQIGKYLRRRKEKEELEVIFKSIERCIKEQKNIQ